MKATLGLAYLLVCALETPTVVTPLNSYPLTKKEKAALTRCTTDLECQITFTRACVAKGHRPQPTLTGWMETHPAQSGGQ